MRVRYYRGLGDLTSQDINGIINGVVGGVKAVVGIVQGANGMSSGGVQPNATVTCPAGYFASGATCLQLPAAASTGGGGGLDSIPQPLLIGGGIAALLLVMAMVRR